MIYQDDYKLMYSQGKVSGMMIGTKPKKVFRDMESLISVMKDKDKEIQDREQRILDLEEMVRKMSNEIAEIIRSNENVHLEEEKIDDDREK